MSVIWRVVLTGAGGVGPALSPDKEGEQDSAAPRANHRVPPGALNLPCRAGLREHDAGTPTTPQMPRMLTIVVGLELAIAALLGALLLAPANARTGAGTDVAGGGAARHGSSTVAAPTAAASGASASTAPVPDAPPRTTVAGAPRFDPVDPLGVVLTGTVRWRDGSAVVPAWVMAERGDVRRTAATEPDGSYAVTGLAPGEWVVTFAAPDAVDASRPFAANDDAVQGLDAVLDRAHVVRVLARTPDGGDALAAVRTRFGPGAHMTAVARREALPRELAPGEDGMVGGDGRWLPASPPRDGVLGSVALPTPPPTNVALLLRHVVLAQQPVHAGQREVAFVVDPEAIAALAVSLRVRVLDAATGAPLPKARVSLSPGGAGGSNVDAEGRAAFDGLLPGGLRCQISAPEHELFESFVRPATGQALDLGDVRLGAAVPLRGRVVDEHGAPAAAALAWVDLKWRTAPAPFAGNRTSRCDANGTFELRSSGHGPVAVTATTSDGRIACGVFDNPSTAPVELRLARACTLRLLHGGDPARGFVVTVLDAGGRALGAWEAWPRRGGREVQLPPGGHRYEVHDERGRLVQSGSVVLGPAAATIEVR
jgi:hypothetical protein